MCLFGFYESMIKKNKRIKKNRDYEEIFKKGKSSFGGILGLKILKNNLGINRFGVIVSTKVSKKAVKRNQIKRKIRYILKKHDEKLKIGNDVVVITLPSIRNSKTKEIEESILKNLNKIL